MGKKVEAIHKPLADAAKEASKAKPGEAADKRGEIFSPRSNMQENAHSDNDDSKPGRTDDAGAEAAGMGREMFSAGVVHPEGG